MSMKMRAGIAITCVVVALTAVGQKGGFQPKCALPFNEKFAATPLDSKCNEGKTNDPGTIAQDVVKDNFCATGTPVPIDIPTLKQLQSDVEAPSVLGPHYVPPKDRTPLRNLPTRAPNGTFLAEGQLVRVVAFVLEAHYSDVGGGESVNCKIPGEPNNDIHMALVADPKVTDECQSVTTEITPHFRPAAWTPAALNAVKEPVRITGQLLFDASHHPCTATTRPDPKRQSSWEIHPLYTFEVCTKQSLNDCDVNNNSLWVSLSEYQQGRTKKLGGGTAAPAVTELRTIAARVNHVESDGTELELLMPDGRIQNLAVEESVAKDAKMLKPGDPATVGISSDGTTSKVVRVERPAYKPSLTARALAILVAVIILAIVTNLLLGKRPLGVLILGVDGRYSNSKFQMCLWFGVLMIAYLAAVILRAFGSGGGMIGGIDIPQNLLMLSGLSALTFAGAKAITTSKGTAAPTKLGTNAPAGNPPAAPATDPAKTTQAAISDNVISVPTPTTETIPEPGRRAPSLATKKPSFPGDLVNDDFGVLSFARFQALIMIIVAVVIFAARAVEYLGNLPLSGVTSLPDIDTTVLAALGLGQGVYLANKVASPES